MVKKDKSKQSEYRAAAIAAARMADDLKAENVEILDVEKTFKLADYFLIATCNSERHQRAVAFEIQELLEKMGLCKIGVEGLRETGWVLLDFDTVIVHLFLPDMRDYYQMDILWGDAKRVSWK